MRELLIAAAIIIALVVIIIGVAMIAAAFCCASVEVKDFDADAKALSFPQHNPGLTVGEADEYEEPSYDAVSVRQS